MSKDQKKTPEKLMTSCSDRRWDDDQNCLPEDKHDTFGTVEVESALLITPLEHLATNNRKSPPEELLASATTDQVVMSYVPSLPPMILPNRDQKDALQGIWICHNCDAHCQAKNKQCGNCKKWRAGKRETVG